MVLFWFNTFYGVIFIILLRGREVLLSDSNTQVYQKRVAAKQGIENRFPQAKADILAMGPPLLFFSSCSSKKVLEIIGTTSRLWEIFFFPNIGLWMKFWNEISHLKTSVLSCICSLPRKEKIKFFEALWDKLLDVALSKLLELKIVFKHKVIKQDWQS